jgi:hypothetical protein
MIDFLLCMPPVVIGERHSIQCNYFHLLATQLKVGVSIGRSINDAPELTLAWIDRNAGTDLAVGCENSLKMLLYGGSAPSRRYVNLTENPLFACCVAVVEVLVPKNDHTFVHVTELWVISVDAFNHDGAGHAVKILASALPVWVCVIPVEAGRSVAWDYDRVIQALSRPGDHAEHIVLWTVWRDVQAVEVKIAHIHAWTQGTPLVRLFG